jgi:vancomycin permeability regulator SanA
LSCTIFIELHLCLQSISTNKYTYYTTQDIQQIPKQDVVVVWGGSKDVGKNETKQGINWIKSFVETNNHTNIILMEVPHRHDLIQDSC